jgi:hypothetical protein
MRLATLFEYMIGRRRAILEVAADRRALGVGAVLVASAALARNYDQVSLLHEPWRLLGAFGASLAISGPLFLTIYAFARWKGMRGTGIGRAYLSFLTLYWMMAPMAWLYGIPYERFLSPTEAALANLRTLGLVSAWRVALMIRVVSVVFGLRVRVALSLVMLVVCTAALTALYLVPLPVVQIMGGISPEQSVIASAALQVTLLCWLTLPIWIVLAGVAMRSSLNRPEWKVPSMSERSSSVLGALAFATLALAAWATLLPYTQPQQGLARRVERAYRNAGPVAALNLISAHPRADFPPGWQPPPKRFPGDPPTREFLDTLDALAAHPHPDWLRHLYSRRFQDRVHYDSYGWPNELLNEHAVRLADILTRLPEGPEMARALHGLIESWLGPYRELTEVQRAALETLLRLSEQGQSKSPRDPTASDPAAAGRHDE